MKGIIRKPIPGVSTFFRMIFSIVLPFGITGFIILPFDFGLHVVLYDF